MDSRPPNITSSADIVHQPRKHVAFMQKRYRIRTNTYLCRTHVYRIYSFVFNVLLPQTPRLVFSSGEKTFPLTFTTHRLSLVYVITHNNVQPRISFVCNSVPHTRHYDRYTTTSLIYCSRIVVSRRGRRTRSKNFLEVHNNKKSI